MVNQQTSSPADSDQPADDPVIVPSTESSTDGNSEASAPTEPKPHDFEPFNAFATPLKGKEKEPLSTKDRVKKTWEGYNTQNYFDEIDFEEVIIDVSELKDHQEYSPEEREEMIARYNETMKEFRSGELVIGKIVAIREKGVSIDIGFKSEGTIELEEFDNPEELEIGQEIEVCIDSIENRSGTLALSKRKAEFVRVWEKINELYRTGEMVDAPIVRRIKGGMVVDMFGIEAFLPGSQIDVHPVRDFDALVGMNMDFRIIKVNHARKNVVLSHKVLVEESLREIREKVLAELEEGQVVEGVVKNITDFGVFVDLGGVDGLLHITDLSWGRVSHPSDVVHLDERITVKVLHYDKEKQRISLGLKQLKEHHWDEIELKYPVGVKLKGKVVSIVKYGAFVELEEGVEGLVHISEMSWTQHIKHPSQVVSVGDMIEVVVLNIDRESRKISLGMKQVDEDPWERLEKVFVSGSRHKGIVRDLVPFGAFVELEPGIDGLIHISDLSWTRKVRHPGEIVKKGQEIEVVILNFDKNERRIALGFKQLEEDPWDSFEHAYPIRARSEGSVIRVLEKGVVVMLPLGVEGFIPNSQLGKTLAGDNKKKIKDGDNLELEVIEFDKANHRIVLSHASVERSKERANYRAYRESGGDAAGTTIGDIVRKSSQGDERHPGAEIEEYDEETIRAIEDHDIPPLDEEDIISLVDIRDIAPESVISIPEEPAKSPAPVEPEKPAKPPKTPKQPKHVKQAAVVKPEEPAKLEEAVKSEEPAAPEEAAEITEPAKSEEPAAPEEAAEITEPVKSEEPATPEEAAEITEPAKSEEPAALEEAAEPAEPVKSEEPAALEEAAEPAEPVKSEEPAALEEAAEPAEPVKSQKPVKTAKSKEKAIALTSEATQDKPDTDATEEDGKQA